MQYETSLKEPLQERLTSIAPVKTDIPPSATAIMEVDLSAIQHNYRLVQNRIGDRKIGAVVKADAYGLGVHQVAPALKEVGCQSFFVADINEAIFLRKVLPDVIIYVFSGVWEGIESLFIEYRLIPVLISLDQVKIWQNYAQARSCILPAILHVDTAMLRTGLPMEEAESLSRDLNSFQYLELRMVMSHLACAHDPDHLLNMQQLKIFQDLLKGFPGIPASLASSGAIFMGPAYHMDMVRPGMVLYGLHPHEFQQVALRSPLRLLARVLQVRDALPGETVGYNATHRFNRKTRIATIAMGYADGYLRPLTNQGYAMLQDYRLPIVGRVSMDLLTIDVGEAPEPLLYPGQWVELVNETLTIQEVAQRAHTIPYEIMVRLGSRYHRKYYFK